MTNPIATTILNPYKDRKVDYSAPVYVYRNLHGKGGRYSIRQRGLVVAHSDYVVIQGARFVVNSSGRNRTLKEARKNVHAFVVGHIGRNCARLPIQVYYDPYKAGCFMARIVGVKPQPIFEANVVSLTPLGVTAGNCGKLI